MSDSVNNKRFTEVVVVPLIFCVAGLVTLWVFDVSRAFECRRADNLCYLEANRFLGLKKSRTAIAPAEIHKVFSRQHALEQGWTYRLYITTQAGPTVGTEIGVNENEAVIEANREKLTRFLADSNEPDVAMKDAPNRLNRYVGLGALALQRCCSWRQCASGTIEHRGICPEDWAALSNAGPNR
jgi:hypothetical protein